MPDEEKTSSEPASPARKPSSGAQAALLEAGILLASDLSLPAVLRRFLELAVQLTGARFGALGVLSREGDSLEDFLTVGISEEQRQAIGDLPRGRGVLGVLIHDPRPIRLDRIQAHPRSVGFPPGHPAMTTFLGAPVRARGKVFGNLYLTEKRNGRSFDQEDEELVTTLAGQAGVAIANAEAYTELAQREGWLRALQQITSAMLSGGTAESLLDAVVHNAREITDAELAAIVRPSEDDPERLVVAAVDGVGSHRLEHHSLPPAGTTSHAVIRTGRPRLVGSGHPGTAWIGHAGVEVGEVLVMPLAAQRRTAGTILIARSVGAPAFGRENVGHLESFAAQAALAIDYLRLQEETQRTAVLRERHRIARDLHDEPIQELIYVARRLERLADDPRMTGPAAGQVAEIRNLALAVGDGLRQLTEGLRSEVLREAGLGPALEELGDRFSRRSGVEVKVVLSERGDRWPEPVEAGWLRIAQEALSNVERHAQASRVQIRLDRRSAWMRLAVADDGIGFQAHGAASGGEGLGLLGMRERTELLGGKLRLRSWPGRGSLVVARIAASSATT